MLNITMSKPQGAKFTTSAGVCLSLAWFAGRYELAYNLGGDLPDGWSDRIWEGGIHEGKTAFLAAKRWIEKTGQGPDEIGLIQWSGNSWEVLDFDQMYELRDYLSEVV